MQAIHQIGIIHSPHKSIENMPIQPKGAIGIEGYVLIEEQYVVGLQDLEGFTHIYLMYFFHAATRTALQVKPFMDTQTRGVFATRSPLRPNHIGLSIVRLNKIEGNKLFICDIDILNNTPLLDIKPYVARFDHVKESKSGWLTASDREIQEKRSDCRFK
jgi:tRNA-Thr(GGU) m(6)t(6)A37 methyltransferase TsaA